MMAEVGIGALLAASGFAVLWPLRSGLGAAARTWLSLPIGAAVYLVVTLVLVIITGTLDPRLALGITAVAGIIAFEVAVIRRGLTLRNLAWLGLAIGTAVAVVILARVLHLTRLTPDSLRYLLFAADLREAEAIARIHPPDLIRRQMGLPALQALAELTDRRYLASIGPLFGAFGLGFLTWLLWSVTGAMTTRRRLVLVVIPALFLVASNRLLYDVFYINAHIQLAVYFIIAVSGVWLMTVAKRWEWAVPTGCAMGAMLLLRPEMPLVVAIMLVVLAATQVPWRHKVVAAVPAIAIAALWYGGVLWNHAPGGNDLSITAPVFGSLLALGVGMLIVVVIDHIPGLNKAIPYAGVVMLAGMLILILVLGIQNSDVVVRSATATFQNLTRDGIWLLTWPVAVTLLVVAVLVHRIPHGRVWTTFILGYGLLFWLLPLLREASWRVGEGDSGNRILAHILPVVVVFLVMAAVDEWSEETWGPDRPSDTVISA